MWFRSCIFKAGSASDRHEEHQEVGALVFVLSRGRSQKVPTFHQRKVLSTVALGVGVGLGTSSKRKPLDASKPPAAEAVQPSSEDRFLRCASLTFRCRWSTKFGESCGAGLPRNTNKLQHDSRKPAFHVGLHIRIMQISRPQLLGLPGAAKSDNNQPKASNAPPGGLGHCGVCGCSSPAFAVTRSLPPRAPFNRWMLRRV